MTDDGHSQEHPTVPAPGTDQGPDTTASVRPGPDTSRGVSAVATAAAAQGGVDAGSSHAPTREIREVAREAGLSSLVEPTVDTFDIETGMHDPLTQRLFVRIGTYSWSFIGMIIVTVILGFIVSQVSTVVVPVIIALFPAAVLQPIADWLKERGVPKSIAALIVLLGAFGIVTAIVSFIAPLVGEQLDSLEASIRDGYGQLDDFLASGPFGLQPIQLNDLIDRVTEQLRNAGGGGDLANNALSFTVRIFQTATTILLTLIVLFFYLKDGPAISGWVKSLFPVRMQDDVEIIGRLGWRTVGGYIQGQLIVAVVDALFIGLGLFFLGVDLALPLGVIVFFGGLFPVVGAGISGFLAAIVALATNGPTTAGLVIILVLVVQNVEGQLLQPLILGRALEIHPLAIILALTVGGLLLGILGAFLAVPVAAALAQTVGYLRKRVPG